MVEILSADVITSSSTTRSDGTLANASASSKTGFLNLSIAGTPVATPTPGDIYTVTSGIIPVDVARIAIAPILSSSFDANKSDAEAVSIHIEVLAGPLLGTEIFLSRSTTSSVAQDSPTGPTAITMQNAGISSEDRGFGIAAFLLVTVNGLVTVLTLYRRRVVRVKSS